VPEARRLTLRSRDADETRALAGALAPHLHAGDVVALSGELGAGKTCFVQGAARALGVTDRVTSPTFMLVKVHEGASVPVVHADVYRLDRLQEVEDLGDEVMSPDAVTFLEWGDAVAALLPDDRLDVDLLIDDPDDVDADRIVHLRGHGSWAARLDDVAASCAAWVEHDEAVGPC
jgi:tRNA threonylcarbamoyladenosine biosynthesis protein TsaE